MVSGQTRQLGKSCGWIALLMLNRLPLCITHAKQPRDMFTFTTGVSSCFWLSCCHLFCSLKGQISTCTCELASMEVMGRLVSDQLKKHLVGSESLTQVWRHKWRSVPSPFIFLYEAVDITSWYAWPVLKYRSKCPSVVEDFMDSLLLR